MYEGICGSHTGSRSLAYRAITQDYWWPNMQREVLEYVRKCDQCQRYAPSIHQPGEILNPLSSPWPFTQWGLDIVRPFSKAVGNKKYLLVCTDYFMKWVEAEPLANIRDVDAKKDSFGRTSLLGLVFLTCSSRTMVFSSIVRC